MKPFYRFINESNDYLDISIMSANKYLKSKKNKIELLSVPVTVEMKYDGIKISIIHIDNTGDYTKDWKVAYKGEIIYPEEFGFTYLQNIKKNSIGNAQFRLIFEHLKKITPTLSNIPKNTEFFIEFLMKKPTLSSNYSKHGMILIASSPCKWEEKFGRIKTQSKFDTSNREKYSEILKIPTPEKIFNGILGNQATFEKSILSPILKEKYNTYKNSINWNDPDSIIQGITGMFLDIDSKYGDHKEEGVVIHYLDGSGKYLKFQQPYQTDQAARYTKKSKFKEPDPELEQKYWENVNSVSLIIINKVTHGKQIKSSQFPNFLKAFDDLLKVYKLDFSHSKKNEIQIKDDIHKQIKLLARKNLAGNNGSLILGRFQPLTKGHEKMINLAKKESDAIVICIVRPRKPDPEKHPIPYELQVKMIKEIYPDAEVIRHINGNIFSIMQKSEHNINVIYAGTDRASSYRNLIKNNPELSVREIDRTDDSIAATQVREVIKNDDYQAFKKLMNKKLWKYFDILKKYIS